jgi:alpha-methylacyl-CoA racemase
VPSDRAVLDTLLAETDVLLTSSRPSSLVRIGLGWDVLHVAYPQIVHVAIVGEIASHEERPGLPGCSNRRR